MKPQPGTYALILALSSDMLIQVGRLGQLQTQPGFYVYLGSALGPGGIRARIAHHEKCFQRPHWHIDYLKVHMALVEVWRAYDTVRREHQWARVMKAAPGSIPIAGFGCSDCVCESHLYFFESRPSRKGFERWLQITDRAHPAVTSLDPLSNYAPVIEQRGAFSPQFLHLIEECVLDLLRQTLNIER